MADAVSIYLAFIKYLKELNKKDKELDSIYDEMDPLLIGGGISLDQAYEEEFSQVILPYNAKEYTIDQAKEILMKYASIYPEIVKHMKEYKKMVDNDLESTISEIQSSDLYKEKKIGFQRWWIPNRCRPSFYTLSYALLFPDIWTHISSRFL